jgi:hypothetical protein
MELLFTGLGITAVGIDFVTGCKYTVATEDAKYLLSMFPEVFSEVKAVKATKEKVEEKVEDTVEEKPTKK